MVYPTVPTIPTSVCPGEKFTLFDGTETPAAGLASVPFTRAPGSGQFQGMAYIATGIPAGSTYSYQVSNDPNVQANPGAANWTTPPGATFAPDANGNAAVTDDGYSTFYRIILSAYTSGAMAKVIVQR